MRAGHLKGQRVTVLGLGLFGGGEGVARYLCLAGCRVLVVDEAPEERFRDVMARLADLPIRYAFGAPREEFFLEADLVVVNPAVPPASPWRSFLEDRRIPQTTEVNLFLAGFHDAGLASSVPLVGVTGTNGKSTTTVLAAALLSASGRRAFAGGNLGRSLLSDLPAIQEAARAPSGAAVVLELSSFQLKDLPLCGRSVGVPVVTNLSPNHLDYHGSFEAYRQAKRRMFDLAPPEGAAVVCADDPGLSDWGLAQRRRIGFGRSGGASIRVLPDAFEGNSGSSWRLALPEALLPGLHNRLNMAAALGAALAALDLETPPEAWARTLAAFRGLPHRLEFVREVSGVRFYNDSKATTPEAVAAALASFDRPPVLIAGGRNKGADLAAFARVLKGRARRVVATGECAGEIACGLRQAGGEVLLEEDFDRAVRLAARQAASGEAVLLSPGCASFDRFVNYEERGERFRQIVRSL